MHRGVKKKFSNGFQIFLFFEIFLEFRKCNHFFICLFYESPMVLSLSSMPSPVSASKPRPSSDKPSPNESSQSCSWTNSISLWVPSNTIWKLYTRNSKGQSNPSMSSLLLTVVPMKKPQWVIFKLTQSLATSVLVPVYTVGLSVWNSSQMFTVRDKKLKIIKFLKIRRFENFWFFEILDCFRFSISFLCQKIRSQRRLQTHGQTLGW